jgi:ATP-binding cassette, subfamily B, bacterial PglK
MSRTVQLLSEILQGRSRNGDVDDWPSSADAVVVSTLQMTLRTAFKTIYDFMSGRRRRQLILFTIMTVVGALAEIAMIASVLPFIALLTGQGLAETLPILGAIFGGRDSKDQVLAAVILFMAFAMAAGGLRLLIAWYTQRFVFRLGHDLAVEVQRRILLQPYSYHIERNSSEVIAATEKVDVLVIGVLLQLIYAVSCVTIALFIVAVLMRIDVVTALVAAMAFGGLYFIVSVLTARRLEQNSSVAARAHDVRFKVVQESIGGIRDVIIDRSQSVFVDAFSRTDRRFNDARASTLFIGSAPRSIIEAGGMVIVAAIALLLWVRQGSLLPVLPILGALAVGAFRLLPVLQQLFYSWTMVAGSQASAAQVLEYLNLPVEKLADDDARPLSFDRSIQFENVGFSYRGTKRPVLRRANATIPAGSRVALVGRTGAGKTTFADLLMGLLSPDEGRILVDGHPLDPASIQRWWRSVAHVPQSVFLADTTIARNIAFTSADEKIDEDRVRDAARLAQLNELIETLPDGLHTRVGERGIRLSGGQRQRLGVARAIYKQAPVLILDEATNALDTETERALMTALLDESLPRRTIIVISHRASVVEMCELVLEVDGSEVFEQVSSGQIAPTVRA